MSSSNEPLSYKGISHFSDLFRNKKFIRLWISQICSQFSTRMITLTLIISLFEITKSNILVVLLVFAFALPALIFGLPAGAYVDRHSRKNVLIATNFFQALLMLVFLLTKNPWLILLVIFIYATINQLYIPSESSMIPALVPDKNLLAANSLFMFTVYGSFIFGYGAAGPIMLLFGNNAPFYLAFFLLLIAFLACLGLPSDKKWIKSDNFKKGYKKTFDEMKEAYFFIKNKKIVSCYILRLTILQSVIGALAVLIPAYADRILHMDVRTVSVLFITPVGIGTVVGALTISKLERRLDTHKFIKKIIGLEGVLLTLLGIIYPAGRFLKDKFYLSFLNHTALLLVIGILVSLLGFFTAMVIVSSQTGLQRHTPYKIRGRVFGVFGIFVTVGALLPMFFMSALADIFSLPLVFLLAGFLIIFYSLLTEKKGVFL